MTDDRREMLDIVCRTAVAAGEAILKVYAEEFDVHHKTDKTPVTAADLAAERIIIDRLMSAFPDIPCVADSPRGLDESFPIARVRAPSTASSCTVAPRSELPLATGSSFACAPAPCGAGATAIAAYPDSPSSAPRSEENHP